MNLCYYLNYILTDYKQDVQYSEWIDQLYRPMFMVSKAVQVQIEE